MDPLPRSVVSLLHGEVRPTCSANGQKVAIIGTLKLYPREVWLRIIHTQLFLFINFISHATGLDGPVTSYEGRSSQGEGAGFHTGFSGGGGE